MAANQDEQKIIISVGADTSEVVSEIDNVKKKITDVGNTPVPTTSFKNYKQAIRDANTEAQALAVTFGKNSQQFVDAAKKVANLKDEFQEYKQTVDGFNPDNKLQSLVGLARGATGAIQGIAGAFTFLGVQSENANQIIAKLQGLMAFSQALNSVDDIRNSYKNFLSVLGLSTTATKAQAVATEGLTVAEDAAAASSITLGAALKAIGIGLLVSAIVLVVTQFDRLKEALFGASKASDELKKINETAIATYVQERQKVNDLVKEAQNENTTKERKKQLIKELQDASPNYFNGIKTESDLTDKLTVATQKYNQALLISAQIKAARSLAEKDEQELVQTEIDRATALTKAEGLSGVSSRFNIENKTGINVDKSSIDNIVSLQKQLSLLDTTSKEYAALKKKIDDLQSGLSFNDKQTLKNIQKAKDGINDEFNAKEKAVNERLNPYNDFINKKNDELAKLGGNPNDTTKLTPADNKVQSERDALLKELQGYFDKVNGIYDDANKTIIQKNLSQRDAELAVIAETRRQKEADLDRQTSEEVKKLSDAKDKKIITEKEYQKDLIQVGNNSFKARIAIDEESNKQIFDVNKKYADAINDYLGKAEDKNLAIYAAKKKAINDEIDKLLLNATPEQAKLLEASRNKQISGVDKEAGLKTVADKAQDNLLNVQDKNQISDKDTPEARYDKTLAINQAQLDAENAAFDLEKQQLEGHNDEIAKITSEHNKTIATLNQQAAKAAQDLSDAERETKVKNLQTVGQAAGSIAQLVGEQTVLGKTLGVAQATIDTYVGATKALGQGGVYGYIGAAAVIAAGLLNIKKILSVQIPSVKGVNTGAGSGNALPSAPSINSTQTQPVAIQDVRVTNQGNQVVKAYITDKELKDNADRNNFLNKYGSF